VAASSEPDVQVVNTLTGDETAKALKLLIAGSDPFIISEDVLERFAFVLLQLVRRSQAQPPDVDSARPGLAVDALDGQCAGRALAVVRARGRSPGTGATACSCRSSARASTALYVRG
jgi:hypothetical protein